MVDTMPKRKKLTKKAIVAENEAEEAERLVVEEEWRDWSWLIKHLLPSIVSFLVTLADFSSLSAVCRSWRSSFPVVSRLTMYSQSPLFIMFRRGKGTKAYYDATHHRIYKSPLPMGIRTDRSCQIFGYTHGHLVVAPHNHKKPILLFNFFTGAKTKLPPMLTDEFVRRKHLLLSSSPSSSGCIAVLLGFRKCFLYCRLGDSHWTTYQLPPPDCVEDAVFVGNRLYALTTNGGLGFFSFVPHPVFTMLEANSVNVESNSKWSLAESDGDLLAIRCPYHFDRYDYDILRWDSEGGCGFVKVSSLGERALFFANGRFVGSLTASVRSGVAGNSIYHISLNHDCRRRVYSVETKRRIYSLIKFPATMYGPVPFWILPSLC